jgi:hypothetical protein
MGCRRLDQREDTMKLTYTTTFEISLDDAAGTFPQEALAANIKAELDKATKAAFVEALANLDDSHRELLVVAAVPRWDFTITQSD